MDILGFLLTLLGIYVLYHFIRFFIRVVLPIIISIRAMKKAQEQFMRQNRGYDVRDDYARNDAREGEVTVEKNTATASKKVIKDDIGEDVPYEEVE